MLRQTAASLRCRQCPLTSLLTAASGPISSEHGQKDDCRGQHSPHMLILLLTCLCLEVFGDLFLRAGNCAFAIAGRDPESGKHPLFETYSLPAQTPLQEAFTFFNDKCLLPLLAPVPICPCYCMADAPWPCMVPHFLWLQSLNCWALGSSTFCSLQQACSLPPVRVLMLAHASLKLAIPHEFWYRPTTHTHTRIIIQIYWFPHFLISTIYLWIIKSYFISSLYFFYLYG